MKARNHLSYTLKSILLIFLIISFTPEKELFAQKEIYLNPEFQNYARDHKTIAILPFSAKINMRPKQMATMSPESLEKLQLAEGLAVQSALHTYYLKRKEQGKIRMNLEVQPDRTTNVLLKKAGVTEDNIDQYTIPELAAILGVQSIVHGSLSTDKPMSDAASVSLGLLVGYYGATNNGDITINISDGSTGTLLWKYDKTLSRSLGSDTQTVINTLMRKASKKWPYAVGGIS